jgi:hypothetical protein
MDLIASRNGTEVLVESMPFDTHTLPGEGPTLFSIHFKPRTMAVSVGSKIVLTHAQLAELCTFYRGLATQMLEGLKKYSEAKGIFAESAA